MDDLRKAIELLQQPDTREKKAATEAFLTQMNSAVVKIRQDPYPGDPRVEWNNIGIMFCRHGQYNLGDKDAEDPYEYVAIYDLGGYQIDEPLLNAVVDILQDWCETLGADERKSHDYLRTESAYRWLSRQEGCFEHSSRKQRLREDVGAILPLYLYDHSGITMSTRPFSCPWDSGQVGWIYCTKDKLQEEYNGDVEAVRRCLETEVKDYDTYLRGDVWEYTIETQAGDDIDSCCGFYGDDLDATGMLDHIDEKYHDAMRAAWNKRYST